MLLPTGIMNQVPSPGVPSRDKPGEGEKLNSGTDVHPLGDSRPPFSENRAAEMEQPETRSDTAKRTHPGEAKQRRDSEAGQESADDHPGIFPTAPDEHPAKKSPEEIYREQKAQRIAKEAARREELLAQAATLRQAPSKPVSLRALPPVAPPTHEDQEADTEWADIADELAHLGALQQDRPLLAEDGGALLLENGGALLLEDGSRIRLEDAA